MASLEDDLRATSDALMQDLERMQVLEREKRSLALDDPRIAVLAIEIEELGRRTRATSAAERELVDEIRNDHSAAP